MTLAKPDKNDEIISIARNEETPRANDTQMNAGTIISIPVPAHTNTATITLALSGGTTIWMLTTLPKPTD